MGQETEPVQGYHSTINSELLGTSLWGSRELSSCVPCLHLGTQGKLAGTCLEPWAVQTDSTVTLAKAARWRSALSEKGGSWKEASSRSPGPSLSRCLCSFQREPLIGVWVDVTAREAKAPPSSFITQIQDLKRSYQKSSWPQNPKAWIPWWLWA